MQPECREMLYDPAAGMLSSPSTGLAETIAFLPGPDAHPFLHVTTPAARAAMGACTNDE